MGHFNEYRVTHLKHNRFRQWVTVFALVASCFMILSSRQQQQHVHLKRRRLTAAHVPEGNADFIRQTLHHHLPMFEPVAAIEVVGPTSFPKPSDMIKQRHITTGDAEIVPLLEPVYGSHRKDQDAVFITAAEYGVKNYILFLESLHETGYQGDVVVAISNHDWKDNKVHDFLTHEPNLVVYVIDYVCYNAENQEVESAKGGIRVCRCDDLYGLKSDSTIIQKFPDARTPRTLQTTRYEIYWIWASRYAKHSWMLLIDARDSVFQANPFDLVPRETEDPNRPNGLLLFFGENIEATRIGLSPKNRKWMTNAYGPTVVDAVKDKPTICSGTTMGEQVAMETYLRAMVAESDETGVVLMGADQGFHNYLYYSSKLKNAHTIRGIVVQDQGSGIVNNMGALRTKELEEWGNGKIVVQNSATDIQVLNWDGTPSPIVHQYDRHKLLTKYFYKTKTAEYETKHAEKRKQQEEQQ